MVNILFVDDEPLMRDALKNIVNWEQIGFHVVGDAFNGQEALKIMAAVSVDVVLTDLNMPVMGGLELIREAAAFYPSTVFVVLSAYDEFHLVSDAYKLGAKEYILKAEMTAEQLLEIMRKVKEQEIPATRPSSHPLKMPAAGSPEATDSTSKFRVFRSIAVTLSLLPWCSARHRNKRYPV